MHRQSVSNAVPGDNEEKSGQGVQSVSSDADEAVSRKWSTGQSTHAVCPSWVWILPAGHAVHAAAAGELLAVPVGHRAHALKSTALLNSPAGQAAQASAGPMKPASHWQVVPPEAAAALAGHITAHCVVLTAQAGAVKPAAHAAHDDSVANMFHSAMVMCLE